MTITALIMVIGLLGLLILIAAIRGRRRRIGGSALGGLTGLVLLLVAGGVFVIASNIRTYQRLSVEQPVGELQFSRIGERQYNGVLTYPTGERADFALKGDEWQIDARVLKWRAFANFIGFDTAFRLERIGGRYTRIEDERGQPRTVFPLNPPDRVDLWELIHRYHSWVPWVDALYGSATYLPMADGALYEIKASQSGLVSRPLNQAARDAVGSWHQ